MKPKIPQGMNPDEVQQRVCRACGRDYGYPLLKSTATRFYCERCMALPADVRATFEHFHKRIKQLEAKVTKLSTKSDG